MKKGLLLLTLLSSTSLFAIPRQVIMIRHAEKPEEGPHLSLKGKERAEALAPFFLKTPALNHHGRPAAIFAQKSKSKRNSMRAQETMKPLADALHMKVNKKYPRSNWQGCVKDILTNKRYEGKMVICCFEHKTLGSIAHHLGVHPNPHYPAGAWDIIWIIDFDEHGKATMKTMSEALMIGDTTNSH